MKFNGRNLQISSKAVIGKNVRIGDNTVIYDNVLIGDNTTICNDCVIGEPLHDYYTNADYENPQTVIGENALIRSHCIIYAGNVTGNHFVTGHRVTIRENNTIGQYCSFGTQCDIQGFCSFGDYCRLQSNVLIGQQSVIGSFVFIYPYVIFTNDPHPPSNICKGPIVGDYTQIATHAVLLPMISIGNNCLIGANATVSKSFGDETVIIGSPAKATGSVRSIQSKEKEGVLHYPWMYHFERGMPWQGIGYDEWLKGKEAQIQ
jgi:UDP-3-O-[3-hydroxymyristoyl] glucosamine N-acyltransferase